VPSEDVAFFEEIAAIDVAAAIPETSI